MTFKSMEAPEIRTGRKERSSKTVTVGEALQSLVKEAFIQNRLKYGFLECAQALKRNPRGVVMCITQRNSAVNSEQHINRKLFEAFCTEKKVRLVQVDSCRKLTKYIVQDGHHKADFDQNQTQEAAADKPSVTVDEAECFLIEKAEVESPNEDFVVTYHDFALYSKILSCPYISIPE